jgi:cation transport ATPase
LLRPFFKSALKDITQRRVSMDLPVALGMLITFVISTLGTFDPSGPFGQEVFFDSLTMFVFFLLTGRWLELRLRDRTAGALEAVMNRLPDSVLRQQPDSASSSAWPRAACVWAMWCVCSRARLSRRRPDSARHHPCR